MKFQLLKVERQRIQIWWICTTFRYNQTQFTRVEPPSLGHHIVYPRLSHPSYEVERTKSHSNLTIYEHWNKEKILKKFTNEYFQIAIAKTVSITCIFNERNLFNSLIHLYLPSLFFFYFHKKQAFKCCAPNVGLEFLCDAKLITSLFIFLIFLVKIWNGSSISVPYILELSTFVW